MSDEPLGPPWKSTQRDEDTASTPMSPWATPEAPPGEAQSFGQDANTRDFLPLSPLLDAEEIDDVLKAPEEFLNAAKRTTKEGVDWRLEWRLSVETVKAFLNNDDWLNAAAISFYAILSFIPFLLLMVSVLGYLTHGQTYGDLDQLDKLLEPLQSYGFVTPELTGELRRLVQARGAIGVTGFIVLLATGGAVFRGLELSVARIWNQRQKAIGLGAALTSRLVVGGVIMSLCLLLVITEWILGVAMPLLDKHQPSWFAQIQDQLPVGTVMTRLMVIGGGMIMLKVLTRFKVGWMPALRAGLLFTILWWLAAVGFKFYLQHAELNAVYGSFAAIMVVVLWTFYSAIILLLSAEYAYAWNRERARRKVRAKLAEQNQ